jgi:lanosterol synthase
MARTRASYAANGELQTTINRTGDKKTDLSRWRMLDDKGNHTWHYLKTDAEAKEWPQSIADKWYLNLDTVYQPVSTILRAYS